MLRVITIDDELPNHVLLRRAIKHNRQLELVEQFTHPIQVLEKINVLQPDVAFVDIEMPYMNGLELAENILASNDQIAIVFVTAFSQYAIDAFKVNALDYILKPIDEKEMNRVVQKILKSKSHNRPESSVEDSEKNYHGRIICLGEFSVYGKNSDQKVQWMTSKIEELLAYLVINLGNPIDKWKLCDLLWPDVNPERASTNLHTSIYRLKKTIAKELLPIKIKRNSNGYWLELEDCHLDYKEFKRLTARVLNNIRPTEHESELDILIKAEKLYGGEIFANKAYLWSAAHGEEINQKYVQLVYEIEEYYNQKQHTEQALKYLERLLHFFPAEEKACRMVMDIYKEQNNKSALIREYQRYSQYLIKELDYQPSRKIQRYYENLMKTL